ncbi:L(+)-tartrate dehydratase subunit alpha [Koleobacter methoxysyntrophicus]|uniref:L(+)-tartrate dehydratase subunit alpha n=1 Tax=Koleobacter methoxysyntrophicus TaxID=2751313 RepID=A0A8A0RNK5_9FIRM|nr:fumarate hydratase [Koleobacter methoxysyntrophicus]QSQ09017.1 L(+)-tartrate dehydratase subunit alpha [Koleobacter methoxysyntrophicus]
MRQIRAEVIKDTVKDLFIEANYVIGKDIYKKLKEQHEKEESEVGKSILKQIIENDEIAAKERIAICQDTGLAVLFIELGQDVRIVGGDFNEAVNQGVREAYTDGYLRKSAVTDPLFDRKNTKDNTPAIIHIEIVPGDRIKILVTPKGFGSENMSALKMLKPADGVKGVKDFVVETAVKAGPNPCPPIIVGVGIGGTVEKAALMAKKATLRPVGQHNPDERYARLEQEILEEINKSGIGPGGLGGRTTALAVNIEHFPTHIAGLPVAVNICCHAARHAETMI